MLFKVPWFGCLSFDCLLRSVTSTVLGAPNCLRPRTLRRTYECLRKRNPDFHDDSDQLRAARSIINKFQFQRRKAKAGHLKQFD